MTFKAAMKSIPSDLKKKWKKVSFEVGENIIEMNKDVEFGYIFQEGSIDVIYPNSNGIAYTYIEDYNAHFVGLMEIYSNEKVFCCTCRALRKCEGYQVSKEDLIYLLECAEDYKTFLIHYWAKQFYDSSCSVKRYPNNSTKHKLIGYLIKDVLHNVEPEKTISVQLKREKLAELMGCSKRTIFRILCQMEEEGYINRDGHKVLISPKQSSILMEYLKNENGY